MLKDLHRRASKGDKVCAVFTYHLQSGDKGYVHWGKVLTVEGSECTTKWQTDKNPSSHSIADVFLTEAATRVLFIAFQVLIVHQRPPCIQTVTTKLQTQKHLRAHLHR